MQQRGAVATPNSRSPVKRLVLRWGASAPQRREVLLPVVLAKTCLRRNMANAAHFTPTGPTISSGCSGATYAAHLAHQHQKAAPVPPAHTCGLRYERSTAGWCAEAAGAGAHSLCLYRGLTTMHASAQHSSGMPRPDRPVGLQVRPLETPVTGLHRRPATSTCGGHNSTSRGRTELVVDRAPLPVIRANRTWRFRATL